jgi:prepilin-type N-terminal cleavage/methylation domain-containing protein
VSRPGGQRGLTLVELTIALALSALVMGLAGSLLVVSLSAWRRGADLREAQSQASTLVEVIARDVRSGSQAPAVSVAPQVDLVDGEPLLSVATVHPSPGGAGWIVYVRRPDRGEVVRHLLVIGRGGRPVSDDARVVATGVERIEVRPVGAGISVEAQVRRGRDVAVSRATASPRNP